MWTGWRWLFDMNQEGNQKLCVLSEMSQIIVLGFLVQ